MHRRTLAFLAAFCAVLGGALGLAAAALPRPSGESPPDALRLPWREAGWSEREAAAHLLDRFAYGARPGEVERVAAMGLDRWMERQLAADLSERALDRRLARLDALAMSGAEMARRFPGPGPVLREAVREGVVERPGAGEIEGEATVEGERAATRAAVVRWARGQGYRAQRELIAQLMAQKLYRAVYAEGQLAEVLTDFWCNHLSVSLADRRTRGYLLAYERDAIRPHVLGRFRAMLGATARHPAMLVYLDNAQSSAAEGAPTTAAERALERLPAARRRARREPERAPTVRIGPGGLESPELSGAPLPVSDEAAGEPGTGEQEPGEESAEPRRRPRGLNENYARELLELHTLGVDGGFTQRDVVEVARAFTGWTILPPGADRRRARVRLSRLDRRGRLGFATDGAFLFRADLHDAGPKTILGRGFPAGGGVEEGEEVLDLLAEHPSTARHVARKLAVRFVADEPPPALVERLAGVFQSTGGDLRQVVRAIAESPEFWRRETRGAKVKSPFELAASALRALDAEVADPRGVLAWTARMGQRLYAHPAPTGYPDRADAWLNTGSLLERMNFGVALAAGEVSGVRFDLAAARARFAPDPSATPERALGVFLGSPEFQRR